MHRSLGILAAIAILAAPGGTQTLDAVREAVEQDFSSVDSIAASQDRFRRWGNAALPHLRELAGKPNRLVATLMPIRPGDLQLILAVQWIDTPEAVEFLIEILDGKTSLGPMHAMDSLRMMVNRHSDQLRSHLRFQQLVFKIAKGGNDPLGRFARERAAETIAELGWEDGEPLLELMLEDPDFHVRKTASECLQKLTGRQVEVRKPDLEFPAQDLQAPMLEFLVAVPNDDLRGRLETWFDGMPALVMGSGPKLTALNPDGASRLTRTLSFGVADFLAVPLEDRGMRWVLLGSDDGDGFWTHAEMAVCVDWKGQEAWRYAPAQKGLKGMCRLYDSEGCMGVAVAVGGEEGVVAFDLDGHELFRVPRTYVTYGVSSHPGLPGVWLHYGGRLNLYDNSGHLAQGTPDGLFAWGQASRVYASEAVLARASDGRPLIVSAGSGPRSTPTIVALEASRHEVWSATAPDRITALALMDPGDRDPLLATTTAAGELLVFDLDGTLRERLRIPNESRPFETGDVAMYSISSGPLPDGRHGLALGQLSSTALFALR